MSLCDLGLDYTYKMGVWKTEIILSEYGYCPHVAGGFGIHVTTRVDGGHSKHYSKTPRERCRI